LSIVEGYFRFRGSYQPPNHSLKTAQPELYQAHLHVGYRLRPNLNTTHRYPASSKEPVRIVSNSDGFRNSREFDERDGRPRILVMGDSFVFGVGVHAHDRLTEQLEALEPRWRVDNMGMTGWGIDLMIRAIEHYGPKADPDIIVLAIYTDDFRRVMPYYAGAGFAYQKFDLEGNELSTRPFPYPNVFERLRIVQFVYQTAWQRNRNRYDLNEALLDRFLTNSRLIEFEPVIVFIPGKGDTQEDRERRLFLEQYAKRNRVPYRDLSEVIKNAGTDKVYIPGNWHWNAAGHRIAAVELKEVLQEVVNAVVSGSGKS